MMKSRPSTHSANGRLRTMTRLGLAILILTSPAHAAEVKQDGFTVRLQGAIETGDTDRLYQTLRKSGIVPTRVILDSKGGDVREAHRLARYIRVDIKAVTEVQNECWSACILAFAGGIQRYAGPNADLRVHRAAVNGEDSPEASSRIAGEYKVFGIPNYITKMMLDTPATTFARLSDMDLVGWALRKGID